MQQPPRAMRYGVPAPGPEPRESHRAHSPISQQRSGDPSADQLWSRYSRTRDPRTRDQIVRQFERLAYSIAHRFSRPGGQSDDVIQVALLGLVKAIDRFDPATNHRFSTFATPTIVGEIKRYFRDNTWNLHVPRGMKELQLQVKRATASMTERLGREPTSAELAARLELPEKKILEALSLDEVNRPLSLDREVKRAGADRSGNLEESLGTVDHALTEAEHRVSVHQALARLGASHRRVIEMRYLQAMTQREVAAQLGVSAMHVNRQEKQALALLREQFPIN